MGNSISILKPVSSFTSGISQNSRWVLLVNNYNYIYPIKIIVGSGFLYFVNHKNKT